jgi:hypothetical protein
LKVYIAKYPRRNHGGNDFLKAWRIREEKVLHVSPEGAPQWSGRDSEKISQKERKNNKLK